MFATIRRYDGVDQNRTAELTSKVNETLVPKLNKLPGFSGYYLIEAGNGVFSSLGLFETPEQGNESSNVVATWIRDEKLETTDPERAEDHEWQGRRSQQRRHRLVARPRPIRWRARLAGPSLVCGWVPELGYVRRALLAAWSRSTEGLSVSLFHTAHRLVHGVPVT